MKLLTNIGKFFTLLSTDNDNVEERLSAVKSGVFVYDFACVSSLFEIVGCFDLVKLICLDSKIFKCLYAITCILEIVS